MDFWKKIQILTTCVVVFESVTSDRWACDRRHYVEFGQRATISCIFPNDYEGVFWYDSADISANLVIKREKQDNGNFITAGKGHSNGSYEIEPDGSLVITNVSNVHDRVFFVSLVDDGRTLHNFEVDVVTIFVPSPPAIVAFGCAWNSSECVFLISETISRKVTCMVTGVYPLVDVAVTVANSTGLTIAQQTPNIEKRGEIFDITVKADIHVQHKSQCSMHDVYCFATGPGTTLFHSSRKITLIIDSCNSRVANIIIVTLIVGVVYLTVFAALWVRYRKTRRTTYRKNSPMSVLEELVDSLTYWKLSTLPSTAIFEEEVLLFLRNVSDEIEKDKKEEKERVSKASTDEIVGDSMAAPTLPQRSVPLLNDGVVIPGTGVKNNIADSWDKLRKDKQKSILVQKPLKSFFDIQKQLVETTVCLNFAYKAIREVHVHTCFNEIHVKQIANMMTKVKMKQNVNRITLMEQLSYMHSCVLELLTIITKDISNESSVLVGFSEWENELQKATSLPFDYLPESIKYLVHNEKRNKQVTFLTFVKLFYRPGQGVSHCGNRSGVRFARQDQGNKQAEPIQSAGVLVDVEDDFLVGIKNNVYRIARSVSVAGVLLSTLGIMPDVAFLGRLISDLEKGGKGRLAGALSEIADMMEKMNLIIKELSYNKQSLVCCCK